ncbi:MAG TPA: hypothetical protein VIN40_07495 [Candidatus Tyrphobacter sp.]
MRRVRFFFMACALATSSILLLPGCGAIAGAFNCWYNTGDIGCSAPQPVQTKGTFANFEVSAYDLVTPNCAQSLNGPAAAQSDVNLSMLGDGWTSGPSASDWGVTSSNFESAFGNSDVLFYSGHGDGGVTVFGHYCDAYPPDTSSYWGIGNGYIPKNVGPIVPSRLKWMLLVSSDTVAPEGTMDPLDDPEYVANAWEPLFTGSLRGLYGFWQAPVGSCATDANGSQSCAISCPYAWGLNIYRSCDMADAFDEKMINELFINHVWQPTGNPEPILSAWVHAAEAAVPADVGWSAMIDCATTNDLLTGPGGPNGAKSGSLCFYSSFLTYDSQTGLSPPIPDTTETLSPDSLQNENLNVAGGISTLESNYNLGPYRVTDNGTKRMYSTPGGLFVDHYYNSSGGAIFTGRILYNAMAVTQQAAQTAATQFVETSFGMPSDAVLSAILDRFRVDNSGSTVLIGYEFVWTHATGNMYGGDAIIVDVDDKHTETTRKTCLDWIYNDPPIKPICDQWQTDTTISDSPAISFGYRLWRSVASGRVYIQSAGRETGGQSIDAYTASLSVPNPSAITGYSYGYWTTPINQATGIAEPAWIFSSGEGQIDVVDAFSGEMIFSTDGSADAQ